MCCKETKAWSITETMNCHLIRRQANEARQVANEESTHDERLAQEQCDKHVRHAVIELENIKAEGFRLATGAQAATQLDQTKSDGTQPRAAKRQRQGQSQRP